MNAALVVLLVAVTSGPVEPSIAHVPAEHSLLDGPPLTLVADPLFSMESGVRTFASLHRLSFMYDEPLRQALYFDESRPLTKVGGILGRLLKLALIDFPLNDFQITVLHEVYGHGSRGREGGARPRYEFYLPFPYRILSSRTGSSGVTQNADSGNLDRDIVMTAGGIEVEQFALNWVNLEMVQRSGRVHYSEQMKYITSKMTYYSRLSANLAVSPGAGDPNLYFEQLQQRFNFWTDAERSKIATRLQVAYWFTYVDPTLWLSAYHFLVTYLFKGERYAQFPRFRLGEWDVFPGTRFNLSPFGAEHYLDVFIGQDGRAVDVYFRAGSTGLATNIGLGARAIGFRVKEMLSLGGELDAWYQPEILFEHPGVFDPLNRAGVGVGLYADVKVLGHVGITGKLAYKTRGYVMGQPTDGGFYGYVGFSIADNPNGALIPWH